MLASSQVTALPSSRRDAIVDRYNQVKDGIKIDYREAYSEILGLKIVADPFTATESDRVFGLVREEHMGTLLSWETAVEEVLRQFPHGKIVDAGLGSGVLSIWAAKKSQEIYGEQTSNRVIGFDINEKAIRYARANALINNVENLFEFRHQSYDESALPEESVVLALLNPPYQLVPPGFKAPIHGYGGFDGLEVVRLAARSAARHVCPGGAICMGTKAIGDRERSLIEKEFRDGSLVGDPSAFSMEIFNILEPMETKYWVDYIYQKQCPDHSKTLSSMGNLIHFISVTIFKDGGQGNIRKLETSLDLEGYGWTDHLEAHRLITNVVD